MTGRNVRLIEICESVISDLATLKGMAEADTLTGNRLEDAITILLPIETTVYCLVQQDG